MELITKMREYSVCVECVNELTKEMDEHLTPEWKQVIEGGYTGGSYILRHGLRKNGMALRFPGATRGHIEVDDDMVITNIVLYDTASENNISCYMPSVHEAVKKFIGSKMIFCGEEGA